MNKFIEVVTNFGNKLSQDRRDFEEETFPNNSIAMNEDAVFPSDDTVITLTPEQGEIRRSFFRLMHELTEKYYKENPNNNNNEQ